MSYNPMSVDDYEAIQWLEEESKNLPALGNAWTILKAYYEECKQELKRIPTEPSPFENINEKMNVYGLAKEVLSNDSFMKECEEYFGISKEMLSSLILEKSNDSEKEWMVAKVVRFYNMHLKLGHSARITYIAEKELEHVPESHNSDLLKRTVLLSALLHDVGRFYQAAHYNDLSDARMKKNEKKNDGTRSFLSSIGGFMEVVQSTHVGAYGFIIQDGRIALIKKARGGYKGLLDIPGGGIEHNETPEDALKRELMEEAGVTVSSYQLLTATSRTFSWQVEDNLTEDLHHIGILYRVEVLEDSLKEEPDGLDSNGCFYYDISSLHASDITPFTKEGLEILGYTIPE
ncbi:MAG: NUDIX hydrolase [Bacilli bacterium]|nr:NUDIX hydrolase [Bacilli bacterium]